MEGMRGRERGRITEMEQTQTIGKRRRGERGKGRDVTEGGVEAVTDTIRGEGDRKGGGGGRKRMKRK